MELNKMFFEAWFLNYKGAMLLKYLNNCDHKVEAVI